MGEYTKYPDQIDTTTELPKVTDLVTPVKAEVVNRQRDAILAIENENGVQPSGTFSTVRARLDAFDSELADLADALSDLTDRVEALELGGGGGSSGASVISSKAKVYISAANFAGAAVSVAQVITWDALSIRVADTRSTIAATTLSPDISGHFWVSGQITISPTIDSISGIVLEVLLNGSAIYSYSDTGAVWGVGLERSFTFSFPSDLEAEDELSVRWTHSGSASSETELVSGENKSWFSFSRICGVD